ncbi:NAD(P)H-binding protein [Amycolatopsis cynarae]|uniref:NAD(P)H-binding protein n=1 Tax=Amycolatopsis cynarae TaxID=2995223 RepID=A0ABY7B5X2_9PSEU|nr:NAD(P)H-binding protein [Amycolatopsis sp. HUAS 11-8]WAL67735.1 NAD(P)H-binding protein [Amycolatopsis sp. HUAS 11-8]
MTGGTGKVGRELVTLLRGRGVPVRVASRAPAAEDPDAVPFDWFDRDTQAAALDGQGRIFLVTPPNAADPAGPVIPFLDEAYRRGVRTVVLLSSAVPLQSRAPELAARVRDQPGGIVLRPSGFMQNFLSPHPVGRQILRDGEIRTASGEGRVGWIDVRDVAACAAALLVTDRTETEVDQRDYLLTGPQALSYTEAAAVISATAGKLVRVVHTDEDALAADLQTVGFSPEFAAIYARADAGARSGRDDVVSTVVPDLTGRPARTFEQFVRDHAARWSTATA